MSQTRLTPTSRTPDEIMAALSAPFTLDEVKFRPQNVRNNRALALAYVDSRVIQDRLDYVLGIDNWQDSYQLLPDNSVLCKLRIRLGTHWVTKMDVGSPSEQPDGGDRMKAAFSDALKRAAVKFGLGRYLYRLPAIWADYDAQKKQFVGTPKLPAFALPDRDPPPRTPGGAALPVEDKKSAGRGRSVKVEKAIEAPKSKTLPEDGEQLLRRSREFDASLAHKGIIAPGELIEHLGRWGADQGHGADLSRWPKELIAAAVEEAKNFSTTRQPARAVA